MIVVLIIALIVVPLVELFVFVQVGQWIGYLPAIVLLLAFSVVGAYLVKREGLNAWRRAQAQLRAGEIPAAELVDGALILFAGALLLTPGFVTDLVGLLLLIPAMRFFPRRWARNHRVTRTGGVVYGRVVDVRGRPRPAPPIDVRGTAGPVRPDVESPPSAIDPPRSPDAPTA